MIIAQAEKRQLLNLVRALERNIGSTDPRNIQRLLYNIWLLKQQIMNAHEHFLLTPEEVKS